MEDIAFKWLKYICNSGTGDAGEWTMSGYRINSKELCMIDPDLPNAIKEAWKLKGRTIITVKSINSPEDIDVWCQSADHGDYEDTAITVKQFKWNIEQMGKFINYLETHEKEESITSYME